MVVLRVATYLMPEGAKEYAHIIIVLASIAIIYGAFATMMQKDLKYINAYSSVSHCGFVLLGIGMLTKTAITGAVIQMVSHGLMTALFFAVIGMIYDRTHTRMVAEMGGLMKVMPFITTVMFIVGLCSLGLTRVQWFCCGDDRIYGILGDCRYFSPYCNHCWPVCPLWLLQYIFYVRWDRYRWGR